MRLEPPGWWFHEPPSPVARALQPLGRLVDAAAARRWANARPFRSALPVVCVGNLTVGGAGKTPLALCVAGLLRAAGRKPGFLTRGYGGRLTGPHVVAVSDAPHDVGDEPLLLARQAPTVLARDRGAGARALADLGVDAIVMDDGLQNPQLAKHLAIAVLDPQRLIGNGLVMPAGPLRESLEAQLRRTDALVVLCGPGEPAPPLPEALRRFQGPMLRAVIVPDPETAAQLSGRKVVAYAGIGRPSKLFDSLRAIGAVVVAERAFPDHHRYTAAEAEQLLALASEHRAVLVTTEKDQVRQGGTDAVADLRAASTALPVAATFQDRDLGRVAPWSASC